MGLITFKQQTRTTPQIQNQNITGILKRRIFKTQKFLL
jgi:hypothetical protein